MTVTLFVMSVIKPGQQAEALAAAGELQGHVDRLGGPRPRTWINQNGDNVGHQYYAMWDFETNEAFGAYQDRAGADPEIQAWFAKYYKPEHNPFEAGAFRSLHLGEVELP